MKTIRLTLNHAKYLALLPLPIFLLAIVLKNIHVIMPIRLLFVLCLLSFFIFILKAQFSVAIQNSEHVLLYRRVLKTLYAVGITIFILLCLFTFVIRGYGDVGYFLVCISLFTCTLAAKILLSVEASDD